MEESEKPKRTIKTVLHAHPHFLAPLKPKQKYNPLYHIWNIDQDAYRLFHPVPSLERIVRNNFANGIGISAISGCHTPTGGMDPRFWEYMKQRKSLDRDFETDYDKEQGILHVAKKRPVEDELSHIILFNSQEVRTRHNEGYADINVSFVNKPIPCDQDIDEVAKMGKGEGGFVSVCHGNSPSCSAGIEKTIEMVLEGKADTAECWNSTEDPKLNYNLRDDLEAAGIYGVAVPDSHHYTDNAAYFRIDKALYHNFSVEGFRAAIKNKEFTNHYVQITDNSKFVNHRLPILILLPLTTLKHPIANTKALWPPIRKKLFGK